MDANLQVILQQLQVEKGVDREILVEAIRSAIESAARKSMSKAAHVTVDVDPDTLAFSVFEMRTGVEKVEDETTDIALEEALELNPEVKVGNRLKVPAQPRDFGRIAAQTAKQVIIQKIKDAERDRIFDEFKGREGELISGSVKRNNHGNIIVAVGRAEAIVPYREQSPRESFKPGDRIRAYLVDVDKGQRGAQVILSRATPELVRRLFEMEVPEIYDGTVEIKGVAREAGSRSKVAVHSNDPNVDPVGACVGMKGSRVRAVVEELSGEKIDIVRWSEDPVELCANALNPADILRMEVDSENGAIHVVVPQDQLSLAIGKRGQNVRLASRLMGWNIDIRGEGEPEDAARDGSEAAPEGAASETAGAETLQTPTGTAGGLDAASAGSEEPGSAPIHEPVQTEAGKSEKVVVSQTPAAAETEQVQEEEPRGGQQ